MRAGEGAQLGNTRRKLLVLLGALAAPFASLAQRAAEPRRIGMLWTGTRPAYAHLHDEFRAGLKSLGYVEGRDIVIEARWADNRLERLPALAAELLAAKSAVLVAFGSPGVQVFQQATSTVPIVFASAGDPVGQRFVQSLRRPGGNITGVAFNEEINKKVYEVAKALLPGATRIAVLVNVKNPAQKHHLDDVPAMAKQLNFEPLLVHATREEELEAAFASAVKGRAQAMVVGQISPFPGLRARIVQLQNQYRVPTFHGDRESVQAGGVGSYSFPYEQNFRRAAALVDQILKGANPAEIPVELPTIYEIGVNLKAAKALGIQVPKEFLLRAQLVVE
jgi:putative ABC transport system substrate-binding protein